MLVVTVAAQGTTWYVDGSVAESGDGASWETAFQKIQEGIDAAWYGETVSVARGTYVENISFEGINITLTSTDPSDPDVVASTIIDGNQAGSVVTFDGTEDESCVLSGFTIQNGNADRGGAICGGTHDQHTHAAIENNEIVSNTAALGGGLSYCSGTIRGNRILDNTAGTEGGGLHECEGLIQNNTISGNSAGNGGGVGSCYAGIISDNKITNNIATLLGGGLFECHGVIRNNVISVNSAGEEGGGLCRSGRPILNNLIVGNYAGQLGGGLSDCYGPFQNNTLCGNSAGLGGGGLNLCPGAIRNCIIWGNGAPTGRQLYDSNNPTHSCISGWSGGGEGNISPKYGPGFVDPDGPDNDPNTYEDNDYHLQADSPCRDAGVNYYWFVWPQQDVDGNCRLVGDRVDMGCYEYGSSSDSDGDLLSDAQEEEAGTDPSLEDTDSDGLRDALEIMRGTDPLDPDISPRTVQAPSEVPTIQQCLCVAYEGDEIIVAPGIYPENLQFCGMNAALRSCDPNSPRVVASTILDGGASGPVVSFLGTETEASILTGFTIRNGSGSYGGGIRGWTLAAAHNAATVARNLIVANHAVSGGGLYGCDGIIGSNIICGNSSAKYGGGFYDCAGLIQNNLICGNRTGAGWQGGGLAYCDATIQNNTICHNRAGDGGGLYGCCADIHNNVICWNSASASGGGLASCNLYFCVGDCAIHDCAIWGNLAPQGPQTHSCGGEIYSLIEEDPGLVDPDGPDDDAETWEDNNYRLSPNSPCIDAGQNQDWMWDAVDLVGNERIIDGDDDGWDVVDIGAYEYRFVFQMLEIVGAAGGGIQLTWNSRPGQSYLVWQCQDLLAGDWGPVATVSSGGTTTTWSDLMPSVARSFYRIGLD
jgi:hypothetical protein